MPLRNNLHILQRVISKQDQKLMLCLIEQNAVLAGVLEKVVPLLELGVDIGQARIIFSWKGLDCVSRCYNTTVWNI
jgi:hypothetical protein